MKTKKEYRNFDGIIRKLIYRESEMQHRRLNWGFLFHGLLFSSFSLLLSNGYHLVPFVLSVIGCFAAISNLYSLWVNNQAIRFILSKWDKHVISNGYSYDDYPPVWAGSDEAIFEDHRTDLHNVSKFERELKWKKKFKWLMSYVSP